MSHPNAVKTFTLVIAPAGTGGAPNFTGTPSTGKAGMAYSFSFTGVTGSPAPTFAMSPATVDGISISSAGVLSGTPTASGSFPITVTASNGVAPDAVKAFVLVIAPAIDNHHPHHRPPVCVADGSHFNEWIWTWLARHFDSRDAGFAWMHRCFPRHHWTSRNSTMWDRTFAGRHR